MIWVRFINFFTTRESVSSLVVLKPIWWVPKIQEQKQTKNWKGCDHEQLYKVLRCMETLEKHTYIGQKKYWTQRKLPRQKLKRKVPYTRLFVWVGEDTAINFMLCVIMWMPVHYLIGHGHVQLFGREWWLCSLQPYTVKSNIRYISKLYKHRAFILKIIKNFVWSFKI